MSSRGDKDGATCRGSSNRCLRASVPFLWHLLPRHDGRRVRRHAVDDNQVLSAHTKSVSRRMWVLRHAGEARHRPALSDSPIVVHRVSLTCASLSHHGWRYITGKLDSTLSYRDPSPSRPPSATQDERGDRTLVQRPGRVTPRTQTITVSRRLASLADCALR